MIATTLRPTAEQDRALASLLEGVKRRVPVQTLGGYAGTGKTTLVRQLVAELPDFAACAFTGKAADVLRRKGVDATTIHGLIYDPVTDKGTGATTFRRRRSLACEGVIVDEASMVGRGLYDDLRSFGLPLIFVGDHGQLEPVNSDFNLMKAPDFRLETIHRNAGAISRFAEWLRMGNDAADFPLEAGGPVELIDRNAIETRGLWREADQMICAFNKSRVHLNAAVREELGRTALVSPGERVICLRNNARLGLFNGMQGIVSGSRPDGERRFIDFDSDGETYPGIAVDPAQFGAEKTIPPDPSRKHNPFSDPNPFDYAYAVTCHKAQGDEFDTVLVFEQRCSAWTHSRWAYTAASRARRKLYWVRGR